MPVTCSIIIPTRKRPALLRKTLESLGQQSEGDFDVIVVVDGEDPQTRTLADAYKAPYPLHWIFEPEQRGQASARNTGAKASQSEILLFLDDDTTPVPDCLHHHLKHHRAHRGGFDIAVFGRDVDLYLHSPRSHTEQYLRDMRNQTLAAFEAYHGDLSLEFSRGISFGLNGSIRR
ncbi:MAG TPA: glycosyltransferase family A protein, partial [Terriglobia bacterium]|nr:glycosyltransferase family A protein [Terriglobia bacterium]